MIKKKKKNRSIKKNIYFFFGLATFYFMINCKKINTVEKYTT